MRVSVMLVSSLVCLLALICGQVQAAEFKDLANELRLAMAQRNFPLAAKKLAEVKEAAKTDAEKEVAGRLNLLHDYLFEFWKMVHAGGTQLQGTEEITVGDISFVVVEYSADEGRLVLR